MSTVVPRSLGVTQRTLAFVATPAVIVFVSSNVVNFGNLGFNMIFSRLMGPELFGVLALMLTIKLAFLGVMGAVQTAVSQKIAQAEQDENTCSEQALSRINRVLMSGLLTFGILLTAGTLLAGAFGVQLGLENLHLLLILLAAVPFGASLSLLRGVAFGRMNATRIAMSANVEMAVRLIGAVLAWQAGFGLTGVVAAISLSIVAGWIVLTDLLPRMTSDVIPNTGKVARTLAVSALPFGLLQSAQVLALDGDIFLAQAVLPAHEAGQIAALSLFQRVQFFACFALASILLPGVVIAARNQTGLRSSAFPVAFLFFAVSAFLIATAAIAPKLLVTLLVGPSYSDAAINLLPAVGAAVLFTFSYLTATFLAALNDRTGIAIVFCAALAQLAFMAASGADTMSELVWIKLGTQLVTAEIVLIDP